MSKVTQSLKYDRRLAWGLAFIVSLFSPLMAFAAAPDISVTSVSGAPGSSVSVSVTADFQTAVNSMQFQLRFDPKLLHVSSVKVGVSTSSWTIVSNPSNTAGIVRVAMFNPGTSAKAASGLQQQVAVIKFIAKKRSEGVATSSALTLSNVVFDTFQVTQMTSGTLTLNVLDAFIDNKQDEAMSGDKNA